MLCQQAIKSAPPVYTPRSDVGEQLGQAILDLASAPPGGVFSCKWDRHDRAVHWGYVWLEPSGCRSAMAGQIVTHNKRIPLEWVEAPEPDRWGLPECYDRSVDRDGMAWVSRDYGQM